MRLAGRVDLVYLVCCVHLVGLKFNQTDQINKRNQPLHTPRSVAPAKCISISLKQEVRRRNREEPELPLEFRLPRVTYNQRAMRRITQGKAGCPSAGC